LANIHKAAFHLVMYSPEFAFGGFSEQENADDLHDGEDGSQQVE
jgi:hypothetical protein